MSNQTNKKSPNNRGEIKEKEINMSLRSIWLGVRDSNPRMLVPKTSVLPLDEPPTCN